MPVRMLQLFGVLLAVAALGVAPSMASTDTSPGANAAGSGGGGCDNNGPWSNWGHNWYGNDGGGRYWNGWGNGNGYMDGNSGWGGCGSNDSSARSAAAGKVSHVQVAVKRLRPSGCQHLNRAGHLSGIGRCGRTHWMKAKGTSNWRFDISRRLPTGRYRLQRRAVDTAGHRERSHPLHLKIR